MSDGSDGAGGVGGGSGSGAGSAGNDTSASDAIGNAADALGDAVDSLSEAVSNAIGSMAEAVGIDDALGQIADALGIDAKDLEGIVGAAIMGAITGGLPGAVMGAVNALVGGSLTDAARSAVADNLPAAMQPFANLAIDKFAGQIPGANTSFQGALSSLAAGALTNGRTPDIGDLGAVARSLNDVQTAARGLMDAATRGDFASAVDAVASLDGTLQGQFNQARDIASNVTASFAEGHEVYANGGHDAYGNAVEQLAVDATRLLANR